MSTSQIDIAAAREMHPARRAMIDSQLRPSGVNDGSVLTAMGALPREDFVPAAFRDVAYMDRAIPLGEGRFLAAPLVHARMLAEAAPVARDVALLVGGSDYLQALLRPLVSSLALCAADEALTDLAGGGFTLIVIDGAVETIPERLSSALAEGGRLVTGLVERGVTRLAVARKEAGVVGVLPLAEIGIPLLAQFTTPPCWTF